MLRHLKRRKPELPGSMSPWSLIAKRSVGVSSINNLLGIEHLHYPGGESDLTESDANHLAVKQEQLRLKARAERFKDTSVLPKDPVAGSHDNAAVEAKKLVRSSSTLLYCCL